MKLILAFFLGYFLSCLVCPNKRARRYFTLTAEDVEPEDEQGGSDMPLAFTIITGRKKRVSINPQPVGGKPTTVDGVPTWWAASGLATIEVGAAGLWALIKASDQIGDVTVIDITADVKHGPAIKHITEQLTVTTVGPETTDLGVTVEPEEEPEE